MREIWQDFAFTGGAKVYSVLSSMITLVITARLLGPEGRGTVAAVTTWAGMFGTLGCLSLGQVVLHRAAVKQNEPWLRSVLGSLIVIAGIMTCCGWAVASVSYVWTSGRMFGDISAFSLAIGFAALPLVIWEQYGSFLLIATRRLSTYNRAEVIARTVAMAGILVLVWGLGWGVNGALCATFIAQGVVSLAGINRLLMAAGMRICPDWKTMKGLLADGLRLHLNAVGTFLFTSVNILLIQYYKGSEQTGLFQFAIQLIGILFIIPQSAAMALFASVSTLGADAAWPANKKLLVVMTCTMIAGGAMAAVASPVLIPLVAGEKFSASVRIFQLLLVALVGQTISAVMAPQWIGRGLFVQASTVTLIIGLLNLVANYILIPEYGIVGAVWATLFSQSLGVLVNVIMAVWVDHKVKNSAVICA